MFDKFIVSSIVGSTTNECDAAWLPASSAGGGPECISTKQLHMVALRPAVSWVSMSDEPATSADGRFPSSDTTENVKVNCLGLLTSPKIV